MGSKTQDLPCRQCQAVTPHEVRTPNHVLHLLLALLSVGLWLPVWIVLTLLAGDGDRQCLKCAVVLEANYRAHAGDRAAVTRAENIRALIIVASAVGIIAAIVIAIRLTN